MSKWNDKTTPKKGWECIGVDDLGKDNYTKCQMCGREDIRYVHTMTHADYVGTVDAGCICSGHMSENMLAAKDRERLLKNNASKLNRLITKTWKISKNGNEYMTWEGKNVGVFRRNGLWQCWVDKKFSSKRFQTREEAKIYIFDNHDKP